MKSVTIGMPVYNELPYIEYAVRSAVEQCATLIISDNSSTDGTFEVCQKLAREFTNIELVRQSANIGSSANFKYLLDRCHTPYFMWLGGHDLLPADYAERLAGTLEAEPDCVLAYTDSQHVDTHGNPTKLYRYGYGRLLLSDRGHVRLLALLRYLSDCSMFYGIWRARVLQEQWFDDIFTGSDRFLLLKAAVVGKFIRVGGAPFVLRDAHPHDSFKTYMHRITGDGGLDDVSPVTMESHHEEMARKSYELVAGVSGEAGAGAPWVKLRAWTYLVIRYTPFASHRPLLYVEMLISLTGRLLRGARRAMVSVVRRRATGTRPT